MWRNFPLLRNFATETVALLPFRRSGGGEILKSQKYRHIDNESTRKLTWTEASPKTYLDRSFAASVAQ